jgi:acetolactate synthase small subunit
MRELMTSLCHDVDYQYRLRADFRRRRVHPTIESLVWAHTVGKPTERVQVSADVTMSQKLDQERELFRKLSVDQLEIIAAESQALVDRAMAMVKENALTPGAARASRAPVDSDESTDEPAEQSPGTDVDDA